MTLSELLIQTNYAYRGSDDDAPTSGTTDHTMWLATINRKVSEWARDEKNAWKSLFEVRELGTISAGTQSYDLDDDVLSPSDHVTITKTDGETVDYRITEPQERGRFANSCYISGRDPQTLTFPDTIAADSPIVGGTISLAGYFIPADLAKDKDTVPVDDPYWLVYAVASELAFNELTYASKAADLVAKANNAWTTMVSNNRRGSSGNPRTARTAVTRIQGSRV